MIFQIADKCRYKGCYILFTLPAIKTNYWIFKNNWLSTYTMLRVSLSNVYPFTHPTPKGLESGGKKRKVVERGKEVRA